MEGTELPGYKKQSFSMAFGGGEIWFEHLDGMYEYSNLVISKLEDDAKVFCKPSVSSLIAINIDETVINEDILRKITDIFVNGNKQFRKIVFVGTKKKDQQKIEKRMKGHGFVLGFINDFQKAKEWLI